MPQHPEVLALLALELFQHSRAAAGLDSAGVLVPLDDQDRFLCNADAIDEGTRMLAAAEHTLQHLGAPPGPTSCTPPAPTCCAASVGRRMLCPNIVDPLSSPPPAPSAAS